MSTQMLIVVVVVGMVALITNHKSWWGILGLVAAFLSVVALVFRVL